MATIQFQRQAARSGGRFYLVMAGVLALVIVAGFSQTFPAAVTHHPGLPLLLHVHGAVFASWLVLSVVQPALIARGSVGLHRKVGLVGAALATAMVVMGVAATLFALKIGLVPPFFPHPIFLTMNLIGILAFGGLVTGGVVLRRRSDWHKRLMLCATISIMTPGLGRLLPMGSFGAMAPLVMFAVQDAFALAGPVVDLTTTRRVHPAYLWGVGVILFTQVVIGPLAFSPPGLALLRLVEGR